MKKENGITIVSLVITIVIMTILLAITIRATLDNNIIKRKEQIEQNFNETIQNTDSKIKTEKDKWEGVI